MTRRRGVLVEGVYEEVVTERVAAELESTTLESVVDLVEDAEAHDVLGRHLQREIERALDGLPREERADRARAIAASVLDHLAGALGIELAAERPAPPLRRLLALHRGAVPVRPRSPFSTSTLFTRSRSEPPLAQELAAEIETADRVDAIIAFVTVSGVNAIRDALHQLSRRGATLRLLTTTYRGVTEVAALDALARLPGAEVRISFDTRRTRLHAKAWLFHRTSGLTTAYVGSANLTSTALGAGHEWMVKACAPDMPQVIRQFTGTFETLWEDPGFERFAPDDPEHRARLVAALSAESAGTAADLFLVALRALPFQEEILDKLVVEREVHGRHRNLVVAATGTGKTVIAALDYVRQVAAAGGVPPRLLFLAHREELLEQARTTFRHALQDRAFGELLVGDRRPERWDHVFASIQSAQSQDLLGTYGAEYFRHVIVDECHHTPARSYQAIVPHLRPKLLVGLTATPERADGRSLLPDFDGHVAAELRLWHALDDQLLVPFEYYGISDGVDLRRVRWTRSGYDIGALGDLYTGNEARADLIAHQLVQRVANPRAIRALGFCVSVEHAKFMAERFTRAGIPALAVYADSPDRETAPDRLRARTVNVLFTCDLYNEGVDLPFVDTLLLLRPTQSSTLFLQQLGRGLRLAPGKTSCLVLDFIGQHHDEFRFDATLAALTGLPRARLRGAVEHGFPYLPSGCALQLDRVARDVILASLRVTLGGARRLTRELRELAADGEHPRLATFLAETGRDLSDVYDAGGWTTLQLDAGLTTPSASEAPDDLASLSRRLGLLQHIDEPERLRRYRDLLSSSKPPIGNELDRRRVMMLETQLNPRGTLRAAEASVEYLVARPAIVRELEELREVLEDRVSISTQAYPVADWALALHRHYSRREIAAAVGYVEAGDKSLNLQTGILKLDGQRELLFVTLDKSGKSFSPTTRYRDYARSPELFHWETQAGASVTRESGRRYVESPGNGWSFYLFVRTDPDAAFAFLGPITYQRHEGDRPIAITWRLATPIPAALFDRYAVFRP